MVVEVKDKKKRGLWRALCSLIKIAPELPKSLAPYLMLLVGSKLVAIWAGATVAAAMGGENWASNIMGTGAGLAVWFCAGKLSEMVLELARNIMFASVSTAAEEALSAPAFMFALMAPLGGGLSAIETAKRVENQGARNFLAFIFSHIGGAVGDLVAVSVMSVTIGAGQQFLWALPATAVIIWLGWIVQNFKKKSSKRYDELGGYAKMLSVSGDLISKANLAKAYGSEALFLRLQKQSSEEFREALTSYRNKDVWRINMSPALSALAMALIFSLGAYHLDGHLASGIAFGVSVAALGAAFARAQQMSYAFEGIASSLDELNKSLDAAEQVRDSNMVMSSGVLAPKACPGVLLVKGLVARRPGMSRPAAQVVSMSVASGEVIWIVGSSGAGKSTLLGAATGTLPHDEGELLWNGASISSWSNLCAWVPQSSVPAPGNLAWNLRLGKSDASDEELWTALSDVGMRERIETAGGLMMDPSSVGLSGGELQRISIARALVSGRPLVALDEPTSALDSISDALVVLAIGVLAKKGAAVLVTSHRLTSIPPGARVLCMDAGVVAEEGILECLVSGSGLFSGLWKDSLYTRSKNE